MDSCRICLEETNGGGADKLIAPCQCRGDLQFVHRKCLDAFRAQSVEHFYKCSTCTYHYDFEVDENEIAESLRLCKFRTAVVLHTLFLLLVVQAIFMAVGAIIWLWDSQNETLSNSVLWTWRFAQLARVLFYRHTVFSGLAGPLWRLRLLLQSHVERREYLSWLSPTEKSRTLRSVQCRATVQLLLLSFTGRQWHMHLRRYYVHLRRWKRVSRLRCVSSWRSQWRRQ